MVTVDEVRGIKGDARLMLALFENGLATRVDAGENRGATLRNDFTVRRLRDLGPAPKEGQTLRKYVEDPWDPTWRKENGGAAVFIQGKDDLAIQAAASLFPL